MTTIVTIKTFAHPASVQRSGELRPDTIAPNSSRDFTLDGNAAISVCELPVPDVETQPADPQPRPQDVTAEDAMNSRDRDRV
jgi:hypothetical protein